MADLTGRDWPQRARNAALQLYGIRAERNVSDGIRVLADIRDVLDELGSRPRISSKELTQRLCAIPEAPWADYKGTGLDERALAKLLGRSEIKTKDRRVHGRLLKTYERAQFDDAWLRYLPRGTLSATTATPGVTEEMQSEPHGPQPEAPIQAARTLNASAHRDHSPLTLEPRAFVPSARAPRRPLRGPQPAPGRPRAPLTCVRARDSELLLFKYYL